MKTTIMTYRTEKTFGDVMGAYRAIQALCKGLLQTVKVNFFVYGESDSLQGLTKPDGSSILTAPNDSVSFEMHLFDEQQAAKEIALRFKAKGFFLNFGLRALGFLNNRVTRFFGIEKLINFLANKMGDFEIAMSKRMITNVLSKKTEKYARLTHEFVSSDLILVYNSPGLFLALLHVYSETAILAQLPKKIWFISEYNGGDLGYQDILQKIRTYPKPQAVDFKMMMTGFPDDAAPEPIIGVFADQQELKELTENDNDLLRQLGYQNFEDKSRHVIFFGYTNYSADAGGKAIANPKINHEFFIDTAIKQSLAFNSTRQDAVIDIILPFTKVEAQRIAARIESKNPNISVQILFSVKKDNRVRLQVETRLDEQKKDGAISVRLINIYPLSPALFKHLSDDLSEKLTVRTGDQSLIESIVNGKVPLFYQVMTWKMNYYLKFITFLMRVEKEQPSNFSFRSIESQLEFFQSNLDFSSTKQKFIGSLLNVVTQNVNIDEHLQILTEIATNPTSFAHITELFQILADKIIKDMNAADKLRAALRESFPGLKFEGQEMQLTEREQDLERKCFVEVESTSAPAQQQERNLNFSKKTELVQAPVAPSNTLGVRPRSKFSSNGV